MANEIEQTTNDEVLDPTNYLSLLEGEGEAEEFDPDAEYALPAPPINDGTYDATIELSNLKDKDGNMVPFREHKAPWETKPHFEFAIKATLISDDPKVNSKFVYTPLFRPLTTAINAERGNTSQVAAAYKAITGQPIKGVSQKEHARQFYELMQEKPIARVKVRNVLDDYEFTKAQKLIDPNFKGKAVYGQKAIMALEGGTKFDGSFSGRAKHPQAVAAEQAGGAKAQYIVARANIDGFAPKES